MLKLREKVELIVVGFLLRHASCRFNRDSADLRAGSRSRRARKVDPQFAQPAKIERGADQRLLQIAVVIAARRPVTLFSPAHVKSIYITAGESSTATA